MTVVLALNCLGGVVIASDSQITDSDRGMSYPAQKLRPLGDRAAWGGSGSRGVLSDVHERLSESADAVVEADNIGRALQEQVLPVLRHHYEHFIADVPGEDGGGTPSAYVLAAGYDGGESWIVEVDPHGLVSRYEDIGFHAIGSGAPMAQQAGALLAHFNMTSRPVEYGTLAVVRVLDALAVSMPTVGGPLDVCCIDESGAHHLDEDEIEQRRADIRRWEELEQKALDELLR